MSTCENIQIECKDRYILSGQFYSSQKNTNHKYPILICPATGITKGFYHSFAQWLSEQGYNVLSFDFRGIGDSLHGRIQDSKASIVQWGQLDIPAAIETLLAKTKSGKVIILGHSAGGQLLGVTPNYEKVAKVVAAAGSTGHIKGLKGRTKILAPIMFKGIFPLARFTLGYGPTNMIGMGENLPRDVAKQWAQFCSKPGYILNAIGNSVNITDNFHEKITTPITAIWASDDEIATEENVKDLLRLYPNSQTNLIKLNPQTYNHKAIGHMLMFKRSHQNLWSIIENELNINE